MSNPDWRKILVAYIAHVDDVEGTDFLGYPVDGLTDAENVMLLEAAGRTKAAAITELALGRIVRTE